MPKSRLRSDSRVTRQSVIKNIQLLEYERLLAARKGPYIKNQIQKLDELSRQAGDTPGKGHRKFYDFKRFDEEKIDKYNEAIKRFQVPKFSVNESAIQKLATGSKSVHSRQVSNSRSIEFSINNEEANDVTANAKERKNDSLL